MAGLSLLHQTSKMRSLVQLWAHLRFGPSSHDMNEPWMEFGVLIGILHYAQHDAALQYGGSKSKLSRNENFTTYTPTVAFHCPTNSLFIFWPALYTIKQIFSITLAIRVSLSFPPTPQHSIVYDRALPTFLQATPLLLASSSPISLPLSPISFPLSPRRVLLTLYLFASYTPIYNHSLQVPSARYIHLLGRATNARTQYA